MPSTLSIREIAEICHEANRAYQLVTGDPNPSKPWAETDAEIQTSAVKGVELALSGVTSEELHRSWCDTKVAQGWRYGPVKDAEQKTHPCIIEYEELPVVEKRKDALFNAVVVALLAE